MSKLVETHSLIDASELSAGTEGRLGHCVHATRSLQIGRHRFPTRADYEAYFAERLDVSSPNDIWRDESAVVSIQNHWLTLGQSGCLFAQRLLRNSPVSGWRAISFYPDITGWDACSTKLSDVIEEYIARSDCELLSLLFPLAVTNQDLAHVIQVFAGLERTLMLPPHTFEQRTAVSIRVRLSSTVHSWVLGFGPYAFLPLTRQAPVAELVVRTKSRKGLHRATAMNGDTQAHVADVPLDHCRIQFDRLWHASVHRTGEILGSDDRALSRARVTFAVPADIAMRLDLPSPECPLLSR